MKTTQMVRGRCQLCAGESIKHVRVWRGGGGGERGEDEGKGHTMSGDEREREEERGGVKEK